jgi:hypothetical protein
MNDNGNDRSNGRNGNGNGNGDRRTRVMSRMLIDAQTAADGLHDSATSRVTDEELASELLRLAPWLKGKKSYAEFLNEVRALAQKLGLLNEGSPGFRNRYEALGKAKPEDRPEGGTGAYPTLSLNAEWPEPTEEQRRAAGLFPTRVGALTELSIQLGLGADGRAGGAGLPPAMTAERAREIADEVMRNRGHAGAPL